MCGIIGYCGDKEARGILLDGLKRLEYRGYDSAGISVGNDKGLSLIKRKGKIKDLRAHVPEDFPGHWGIGHTRWATHGGVTDENAHPHLSQDGKIAIVHNGIIENYQFLKDSLIAKGYEFSSETDSEVIVHLLSSVYEGDLLNAINKTVSQLKGTFGLLCMHADLPNEIIGIRNGSPLVLGVGHDEMLLASDVSALVAHTKSVVYLDDGEMVHITSNGYKTYDINNSPVSKEVNSVDWEMAEMEKQGFEYFMEKEIYEQPESIMRAMRGRLIKDQGTAHLGGLNMDARDLLNLERVTIMAAGTSYYAGMIGAYLLESMARIPSRVELSSELRYKNPIVERNSLYFAVSQSGETADTLYGMREIQRKGGRVLGICNIVGSSIARESDGGVFIHSGPEIAVASTKAFTSQITVFYLFALLMARIKNMSWTKGVKVINELENLPEKIQAILGKKQELEKLAEKYCHYENFLFLGRGVNYPVAMEGALKLKEISYIHAEGYSAAEIKHGPIALINEETPSVFLVPNDSLREKIISNLKEVKARNGQVIAICEEGDQEIAAIADDVFTVPAGHELMNPFLMAVPLQLFSFYCALKLGRDVDQPRNLAKSVTVE